MSGGASAAVAIDAANNQPAMINDARQARVSGFALTGTACPRFEKATADWFEESTVAAQDCTTRVTVLCEDLYSFGTHEAIEAERVPVA